MNDTDKYLFLIGVVFKELMFLILITAIIIIYCSLDTKENETISNERKEAAAPEAAAKSPEAAAKAPEATKYESLFDLLIKAAKQFLQLLKAQTIPDFTFYIVFIFYYIVSIVIGYLYNPPPRGSRKDKIKDWWTFMGNETIYRMFIIFVGPLAIFVSLGILYMLAIVGQNNVPKLLESIRKFTLKKIMAAIVCVLFIYFLIEIIVNVTSKRPIFKRGSLETNILRGATLYTTIGIMAGLTFLLLFFTPFSTVNINYLNEQWKEITPNIFFLWFLCLCVALIVHISFLFDISYVIAAIVFMLFFSYLSK
jgi:hypothetical protein